MKNRLRLWLRSERALGLATLPVKLPAAAQPAPAVEPSPRPHPVNRQREQIPRSTGPPRPASRVRDREASPEKLRCAAPAATAAAPPMMASIDGPVLSTEEKQRRLAEMDQNEVRGCSACRLCGARTQTVFGEGNVDAEIVFIGEGPGGDEDRLGRPFVGRAGRKLTDMIEKGMGLAREAVYIANVVKCRPPDNRTPVPDEVAACTPYLVRQLEIIRPKVIVTLGLPATQFVLQTKQSMGRLRGRWGTWRGIKVMPTYHPSYLLRNYTRQTREAVWSDLQQVMAEVGLPMKSGSAGPR